MPQKDISNLIEAFALLNRDNFDFHAVLVGTDLDHSNQDLVGMLNKNGLKERVNLQGRRNDIVAVMNGIDLFVLSSKSEAFPNVLNEAMLCGTPCITTNVGDARVIVGDTGWVVTPKNPQVLANAILQAAKEKQSNNNAWLITFQVLCQKIVNGIITLKKISFLHFFNVILEILKNFNL